MDVASQTRILTLFRTISRPLIRFDHVVHMVIFLRDMFDFEMNVAYAEIMGSIVRPAPPSACASC